MSDYSEEFFSQTYVTQTSASAREVVEVLWPVIQPSSVIDVGCGIGLFLEAFSAKGVKQLCGVDGSWVTPKQLHIRKDQFVARDLGQPLDVDRRFDLVVCLEVAEHLPPECAPTLVDSLVHLGPVILFSAAVPLQGGVCHVNEQWPEYWIKMFRERGFQVIDCMRKRLWDNEKVLWYYSQNMLLFVEEGVLQNEERLQSEFRNAGGMPLSVIHPRAYLDYRQPKPITLRTVLSVTKGWVLESCARITGKNVPRNGQ